MNLQSRLKIAHGRCVEPTETIARLEALIRPVGTRDAASGYFFHALYPVMRAQLAAAAERPLAHQSPRWQWLHRVAARLFDLEERLLPARWYGTSLWGVADR